MTQDDWSNLPTWLPAKIADLNMSIEQFATASELSRTAVYEYLYDNNRPTEETALRMSRVLGVPYEEFLAQYVPKKNGRPRGSGNTSELKVRR